MQRRDDDQFRGSYRQDLDRGDKYDQLNRRNNFNDRDISQDYRSAQFQGTTEDLRRENTGQLPRDYGRDPNRRGERLDNFNPHEDNNGLEGATRNFGNMGSYGGAQGWGTSRGGSHQGASPGNQWASGHGRDEGRPVNRQIYGAYRDRNSFALGEREQYDGTSRYGTQGADTSRGIEPSEWTGPRGGVRGTAGSARRQDDSRYEIYDDAESNYSRGEYGNQMGGGAYMGSGYDRRTHGEYGPMLDYNQAPRERYNQEGEGMRTENYGNMAGTLSYGIDWDYRSAEGRNRLYDPMSGHIRRHDSQPPSREDFNW
ncbi:hypothetical protein TH63_03935 [Rufibacter radiotolerans]|uniref:Uncharacterized protein n=2 Tax=Rufibacter radiotolerans TaxID=1379910 RepID=A0A0H4W3E9_9BACT|nr:hypothetical protein TH63_03935 [Rufibacter radiotolerans]